MRKREFRRNTANREPAIGYRRVCFDGEAVGLALGLGTGFLFYTTDRRLQALDGRAFADLSEIRAAIDAALTGTRARDEAA